MKALTVLDAAVASFVRSVPVGVLATVRPDGTPRLSTVYFVLDRSTLWISTERQRAKARDVVRTGRASLCVVGPAPPYPSVTLAGAARLQRDAIAEKSAQVLARISGGEPVLSESDLEAAGRVLLRIDVDHVYGVSYIPQEAAT